MGGRVSGRHYHLFTKNLTTTYKQIDVRRWARDGLLEPGNRFATFWTDSNGEPSGDIRVQVKHGLLRLIYRARECGGEWEPMDYPVSLLSQPCNFGGYRAWFACPARGCGRQVAILYGGRVFACRTCHQLAYPSSSLEAWQRHQMRADRLRRGLGWDDERNADCGIKPKGMHWRTFMRLADELDECEHRVTAGLDRLIGLTEAIEDRFKGG